MRALSRLQRFSVKAPVVRSGGPKELPPKAPTDPYVKLSLHTALLVLHASAASSQGRRFLSFD